MYIYGEIKYIRFRDLVILRVEQRLRSILFVTGQLLLETSVSIQGLLYSYLGQPYRDPGILIRSVCRYRYGLVRDLSFKPACT